MSKDWNRKRDAMSEAWYLPESKQEPVAIVGSGFSLLWVNRGHHGVSVGNFLYTAPLKDVNVDLLEALQDLMADLKLRASLTDEPNVLDVSHGRYIKAEKAIAKALGERNER